MRASAFVKTINGKFPDVNFFQAWKGLQEIGYDVILFSEDQWSKLPVKKETPIFAGVGTLRKMIQYYFGWEYTGINPYPKSLKWHLHRSVKRGTWRDLKYEAVLNKMFVKPVVQKRFNGFIYESELDLIKLANFEDDEEVYISDRIIMYSEFRVYVHHGEIQSVKHYMGDWSRVPDQMMLDEMIRVYEQKDAPVAYAIDVAKASSLEGTDTFDCVVEVNDAISLGNYSLNSYRYALMISDRWKELVEKLR